MRATSHRFGGHRLHVAPALISARTTAALPSLLAMCSGVYAPMRVTACWFAWALMSASASGRSPSSRPSAAPSCRHPARRSRSLRSRRTSAAPPCRPSSPRSPRGDGARHVRLGHLATVCAKPPCRPAAPSRAGTSIAAPRSAPNFNRDPDRHMPLLPFGSVGSDAERPSRPCCRRSSGRRPSRACAAASGTRSPSACRPAP